jgi:hypothetical protein
MKNKLPLLLSIVLIIASIAVNGQNDFKSHSYYQITDAWYISTVDTVNVSEDFKSDYFFIFFIEDSESQMYFTIRGYEHNEVICLGTIDLELVDEEDQYKALIYKSDVYFNNDQDEPIKRIILENIPNSKEETGYDFYYVWLVLNNDEAFVFQCFDLQNLESEE